MAADRQLTRPYHAGGAAGAIEVMEAEIVFGTAAKRQLIGTVPAGALVLTQLSLVRLMEAFNAGTSNLITVGYGAIAAGTADDIVATVTEGTPAVYPGVATPFVVAAETDIYAYYTPGDVDADTGIARAVVAFVRLAENG